MKSTNAHAQFGRLGVDLFGMRNTVVACKTALERVGQTVGLSQLIQLLVEACS